MNRDVLEAARETRIGFPLLRFRSIGHTSHKYSYWVPMVLPWGEACMKEGGRFEVKIFSEVVTTVYFIAGLLTTVQHPATL